MWVVVLRALGGLGRAGEGSGDAQNEARGFRSFMSGSQGWTSTLRQAAESPSTQVDSSQTGLVKALTAPLKRIAVCSISSAVLHFARV